MKKLIYLILTVLIVACSGGDEDKLCLVCTNMDFNVERCGVTNCAFEENEEICEGDRTASCCFPGNVPTSAEPLTASSIYAIKTFWESNGAICTLNR